MSIRVPRSPYDQVDGIVYFGRMLDKIRLESEGALHEDYIENLGEGFDARCTRFLHVSYPELKDRVLNEGGTDEQILQWCRVRGRTPTDEEIDVWNEFMRKRGWRDSANNRLKSRLEEAGFTHRDDIQTMFDFIDLDEGRDPGDRTDSKSPEST